MAIGTAVIADDAGLIETDPPTPVSFRPSSYPAVTDGMRVYFERRSDDPGKASFVRPATAIDQLVAIATPSHGLTPAARKSLDATTAERIDEFTFAPGADIREVPSLDFERLRAARLAARLEAHTKRPGVAILRSLLEEGGPAAAGPTRNRRGRS